MRNLNLDVLKIRSVPLEDSKIIGFVKIEDVNFILSNNSVRLLKDDNVVIIGKNVKTMKWIAMENVLYMGTGDTFICYNIKDEQTNIIEIPGGYLIHDWNPSEDRVALIDNESILRIVLLDAYNSQCTFIGAYQLDSTEKSPFINIGWGSQTTQFTGSDGKCKTNKDGGNDSIENLENSPRIAWRDDGYIFAVSFTRHNQRIFKVFTCECEFLYQSEIKPGMSAEIAWKPDGSLIATENRCSNVRQIMFFEKNGLHRYDLLLPTASNVMKLQWNSTGDILMVWQQSHENSEISLWTCTNFKWYLKQKLFFDNDNAVNYVSWIDARWLEVITAKKIIKYSWKWVTLCSQSLFVDSEDLGIIAVIDGNLLRISVTSAQIIPPPHSSYNIEFTRSINFVTFGFSQNILGVVLSDYTFKMIEISKSSYIEKFTGSISYNAIPLALNNFVFDEEKMHLYCVESLDNNESSIHQYKLDVSNNKISQNGYYEKSETVTNLLRIFYSKKNEYYLGLCVKNRVTLCRADEELNTLISEVDLNYNTHEEGGIVSVLFLLNAYHTLSLNAQHFYFDGEKIANNITSYLFCQNYLLLTTCENKLLSIKLNEKGLKHLETRNLSKVYARSIPSGSLLISAVPKTRKIIFQIPRGELEIINSRVLAIGEIDRLLANKKYLEAFRIMKTDRINSNLLYDLNPKRFLNDIEDLIKSIHNCEYLDVFLTQLQDNNISEELYGNCFEKSLPVQSENKLFTVADKFIQTMMRIDVDFYLQSIITAYICKGRDEDFEKALEELSLAKQQEEKGKKLRVPVDSILEHMIILSSVEKLYDVALAMDHLELIMWVASKSQLDPLEYIPFLRELINMEHNYRNYKINYHIRRFEKAFTFLVECDNVFNELTELVSKNNLYRSVLKYVRPNNQWFKPLYKLCGEYLQKEKHYKEAGYVFMKIKDNETAFDNFVKGCCIIESLIAFHLLGSNITKMNDKLTELAMRLTDNKQYKDACYIYDILCYYEDSVSVLLKGCLWNDAYKHAIESNRWDIIESEIVPSILSHTEYLHTNVITYKKEFIDLKTRLLIIRTEHIKKMKDCGDIEQDDEYNEELNARNLDMESTISTVCSRTISQKSKSSLVTSASLRRKKRIEKKILQIREGSAFENVAILRRLHLIITEVQGLVQTISDTCIQFVHFTEHYEKAIDLRLKYKELLALIESSKDEIWPIEMILPPNPATIESQVYRKNLEYLEIQYRSPPKELEKTCEIFVV